MTKEIHSVLIQGGDTPGIRMEVEIPASAPQYAIQTAKAQYKFSGAQYIWQGSNNINPEKYSSSSSGGSLFSGSTGSTGGDFLIGVVGLVGVGCYYGVTKVAYPVTKFVVTKAVVPATIFTGKYTWKGMKYVSTTTVPQVYNFTKNTVVPGMIQLGSDIVTFVKELINKVMGKVDHRPSGVMSQYRRESI